MRDVVNAAVGLLGGLLLSVAFWYFVTHRLVPKVAFGEKISALTTGEGKVYRVKLANMGTRRGVLDVAVDVRIAYRGITLYTDGMATKSIIYLDIPHDMPTLMRLAPRANRIIRLNTSRDGLVARNPIVSGPLGLGEQPNRVDLEWLLSQGASAHLIVRLLCYDEWSGSRKYFESRQYTANDIANGHFSGLSVRAISPRADEEER